MTGKEKALSRIKIWTRRFKGGVLNNNLAVSRENSARVLAAIDVLTDVGVLTKEEAFALCDELVAAEQEAISDA